ncbi:MAG: hypothetical protein OQL19_20940 [Gammaproteobacteria bacterium]|nr:hypothetical protein [Gammaproteobacteria bacterium]
MNASIWSTYCKLLITVFCGYLLIVAFKTYQADPYWLWHEIPDWYDEAKGGNTLLDTKQRFTKLLQVVIQQPDIVILGSSRVYRGFDSEILNQSSSNIFYNMGISSLKITELEAFVKHIVRWTATKKIIIGLDFHTFRGDALTKPGFIQNTGALSVIFDSFFAALCSKMALKDAKTVYKNREQWLDGKWTYSGYKNTTDRNGELVTKILKSSEKSYIGLIIPEDNYVKLAKVIAIAKKKNVDIEFFLTPMTQRQLDAVQIAGLKDIFQEWRSRTKQLLHNQRVSYLDLITAHPFDKVELSTGSNQVWIDYHHYKPTVGTWILSMLSTLHSGNNPRS